MLNCSKGRGRLCLVFAVVDYDVNYDDDDDDDDGVDQDVNCCYCCWCQQHCCCCCFQDQVNLFDCVAVDGDDDDDDDDRADDDDDDYVGQMILSIVIPNYSRTMNPYHHLNDQNYCHPTKHPNYKNSHSNQRGNQL